MNNDKGVKLMIYVNVALTASLALVPWVFLGWMPAVVPTHWGAGGEPNAYGSSCVTVAILSGVMPIANIIILVTYFFRWTLVRKYPYLINLPAIAMVLGSERIDEGVKERLIERIFQVSLVIGLAVGAYLLLLELGILYSMITASPTPWVIWVSLAGVPVLIAPPLTMYRKIYREEIMKYLRK